MKGESSRWKRIIWRRNKSWRCWKVPREFAILIKKNPEISAYRVFHQPYDEINKTILINIKAKIQLNNLYKMDERVAKASSLHFRAHRRNNFHWQLFVLSSSNGWMMMFFFLLFFYFFSRRTLCCCCLVVYTKLYKAKECNWYLHS